MTSKTKLPKPKTFGLKSFGELLGDRLPIPGEAPGTYEGFQAGLMLDLAPATPYEMLIAEHLIMIEWDLHQHRRMRDQAVRKIVLDGIRGVVIEDRRLRHKDEVEAAEERWCAEGHAPEEFTADPFDQHAAYQAGDELGRRTINPDLAIRTAAHLEVEALGVSLLDFMSHAVGEENHDASRHELKIQELERRRRGVRSDYESLQKRRPINLSAVEVHEAEVLP